MFAILYVARKKLYARAEDGDRRLKYAVSISVGLLLTRGRLSSEVKLKSFLKAYMVGFNWKDYLCGMVGSLMYVKDNLKVRRFIKRFKTGPTFSVERILNSEKFDSFLSNALHSYAFECLQS
ncbi:unnamed protein product [Enterobius vermicularis]|uniref:Bestrophin homolog n=1 Tax=Enterobius vermicularis TaxID=51028 RepID=A0A0N4V4R5_ENTVE|nr:unnamed protein product [Enterobius vermicularis]